MTIKYILQRINTNIFKEPVKLIVNIFNVTKHIRGKIEESGGDVMKETLNLIEAKDGKYYTIEEDSGFYRVYNFIEGARTYQSVENREDFYNVRTGPWEVPEAPQRLRIRKAPRNHSRFP